MLLKTGSLISKLARLSLITLCLGACTTPTGPLSVNNVTVFPEPKVGQIVELSIELLSTQNEAEVKATVDTLEDANNQIHLVSGETEWHGSLNANEPKTIKISVCVMQEGLWPIEIYVVSKQKNGDMFSDAETTHFVSTLESGQIILARDFSMTQDERNSIPTPRPFDVSTECSGK